MKGMSIKYKILVLPLLSLLGFLGYLGLNTSVNSKNGDSIQKVQNLYFPRLEMAKVNESYVERMVDQFGTAVLVKDVDLLKIATDYHDRLVSNLDEADKLSDQYEGDSETNRHREKIRLELENYYDISHAIAREMISDTADMSSIQERVQERSKSIEKLRSAVEQELKESREFLKQNLNDIDKRTGFAQSVGLSINLVIMIILLVSSFSVITSIDKSMGALRDSLKDIAQGEGNLTLRIKQVSTDEVGVVVHWFNQFIEKLHGALKHIVSVVSPMADVSRKLHTLASEVKSSSANQLGSVNMVNEDMHSLIMQIEQIIANTASAAMRAHEADAAANEGRNVVKSAEEVINSMAHCVEESATNLSRLSGDVNNVSSILEVIRGIAEQTNLLALNAAIEAARAGEQGRGFAVVADEVRTLAARTQSSTKEIHTLIEKLQTAAESATQAMESSRKSAQQSVELTNKTGQSLQLIADKVSEITHMNEQISIATKGQEVSSQAVRNNILHVKRAAETLAESTTAMLELSNNASTLSAQINSVAVQFRV